MNFTWPWTTPPADATDANMLMTTCVDGWTFIARLPADAVQLGGGA